MASTQRKDVMYTGSICLFWIFQVFMVFISVGGVIVYRVIMTVDYCSDDESSSSINCLLLTTVVSSLLNAISILVLGKIYDILAVKLTDWGKFPLLYLTHE